MSQVFGAKASDAQQYKGWPMSTKGEDENKQRRNRYLSHIDGVNFIRKDNDERWASVGVPYDLAVFSCGQEFHWHVKVPANLVKCESVVQWFITGEYAYGSGSEKNPVDAAKAGMREAHRLMQH